MYRETIYDVIKTIYPDKDICLQNKDSLISEYILIKDVRGRKADRTLTKEKIMKPSIEIRVCFKSHTEALSIMETVNELLNDYTDEEILSLSSEFEPIFVGADENDNDVFYCIYSLQVR